jgi:hypothetical protein
MKASSKWVSGIVLGAVIAVLAIAPVLKAAPPASGKFTLPFDAQWGEKMALPTGEYTYSVNHLSSNGLIWVYRGKQAVGIVIPQVFETEEIGSKNPELVLIRHDGKTSVRALRLPGVGTFYFHLPKELNTLVTEQPRLIETVTVQVNGD